MGDFGTLFPLAIGYIVVCGMNPAGFMMMMGLTNIALGLIYKLPMPVQPKKVIAVMVIAQRWQPRLIYASGFGTGVVWLFLSLTGCIQKLANHTPKSVVRGIQIALGVMLGWQGLKWIIGWQELTIMSSEWITNVILGAIAIVIVLTLRENRYAPAAVMLIVLGIVVAAIKNEMKEIKKRVLIIGLAALLVVGITPIALSREFGGRGGDPRAGSGYSNPDMMLVLWIAVIAGAIFIVGSLFKRIAKSISRQIYCRLIAGISQRIPPECKIL